jgi:urea transport system substrate-binding protein
MKVGLLHPRSGVAGMWSPSMDAAALVGAAEINATGGILGEEIELVFGDCGFSASEALGAVDTLIEVDGVDAILGGHPSNIRDAVSERISSKVPYIYTPQYEGIACGPSTIAIGSTDHELMAPALQWLRTEKSAERYFFVGNDYIWPRMALTTTRTLMREQGTHLVGHAIVPFKIGDYSGLMKQIVQSGAQVVIQALVGLASVEFNRAFAAAGLDEKMLRFGLIVDETVICGIGAEASNNLFTAASYFADHRSRSNDHFLELYHDAFGALAPPVSAASVGFYEGLHVLAGLANDLRTRNSRALAHHLHRPMPRPTARHMLDDKPVGQWPLVYMGRADGVTLQVVAALTH